MPWPSYQLPQAEAALSRVTPPDGRRGWPCADACEQASPPCCSERPRSPAASGAARRPRRRRRPCPAASSRSIAGEDARGCRGVEDPVSEPEVRAAGAGARDAARRRTLGLRPRRVAARGSQECQVLRVDRGSGRVAWSRSTSSTSAVLEAASRFCRHGRRHRPEQPRALGRRAPGSSGRCDPGRPRVEPTPCLPGVAGRMTGSALRRWPPTTRSSMVGMFRIPAVAGTSSACRLTTTCWRRAPRCWRAEADASPAASHRQRDAPGIQPRAGTRPCGRERRSG